MRWILKYKLKIIPLFVFVILLISGCSSEGMEKLWLKSDGWSRGVLLGETGMAAPADFVIDESGIFYTILFPKSTQDDKLYQPVLVILSQAGELEERILLDFQISQPKQARIILTENGIDLIWIDSYQVKMVQLDNNGNLLSDISLLSGEERVNNIEVIYSDETYTIWYAGRPDEPGLYALSGPIDDLQKDIIDPLGIRISLFRDAEDQLHCLWAHYPVSNGDVEFYYLETDLQEPDYSNPTKVFSNYISPARRVEGPFLVVDKEVGYLIWSELIVTGLESGQANTHFRYFPLGQPEKIRPEMDMRVPAVQNLDFTPYYGGIFNAGNRIILGGYIPSTNYLENISSLGSQFEESVLVFRSRSEFKWRDFRNQVNVAYISDGLMTSYQPLSYTSGESYHPQVKLDQEQDLYVTWLEKGEITYRAYLSTTDIQKKSILDIVTIEDYFYLGAEGLFGLLAGIVLSPFAVAVWGGAGLVAFTFNIILSRFNHRNFRTLGEVLSIIGGILIFWIVKWETLPGLRDGYVPFSAWIPRMPPVLESPLVIGIPIIIGVISFAFAWSKTYGKGAGSPINFHFIYAALDTVMSCAIYGILIYGSI